MPMRKWKKIQALLHELKLSHTMTEQELSKVLTEYVSNITEKVIHDHIFKDVSEATVMAEPKQIE